jgi:hypothetical protein
MEDAVLRAARMPEEEYRAMVAELEKLRDEVRARSERNLKDMIDRLENRLDTEDRHRRL